MNARADLLALFHAALTAVEPYEAVRRFVTRDGDILRIGAEPPATFDLTRFERVYLLGAGKAAAPMARALEQILGDSLTAGVIVVKYDHKQPLARVELREAGHPIPDENGLRAGDAILALARQATARDLVFCLLSGGGSALLEALPAPLTLADLQGTTDVLLASGATIGEVNTIRKHLSRVKAGRLAQAIAPAALVTVVLSDVIGSSLSAIASGPTVPDSSRWADVHAVMARYDLARRLPPAVTTFLQAGIAGQLADTPKTLPAAPVVIVGDNAIAARKALDAARGMGYEATVESDALEGEAAPLGRAIALRARHLRHTMRPDAPPRCLIFGGESTVTLGEAYGKGGRNQTLTLAAALELDGISGITLGAFATDGSDGPTDSAGAIVDGGTLARGGGQAVAQRHLATHDAYPFLRASGDLLTTGATRTNVNDLVMVIVGG